MKIFENDTVQSVIKHYLEEQLALGNRVTYQKLADLLRIQKSYLSKIMRGDALMSKDQGFLLAQYLKLNNKESDYLFLLLDRDKAAIKEYKNQLDQKIKSIQNLNTQSQNYIEKEVNTLNSSEMQLYYLNTETQLIHLALALPNFKRNPELLKDIFRISTNKFQEILNLLIKLGFIEIENGKIKNLKSNLHLPKDSPFFWQWFSGLRNKSLEWTKSLEDHDKYNFSANFTASEEDKEKIRIKFMSFLKDVEKIVKDSPSENLYQISFDLFKWI